jgi:hypothetical protein
MAARTVNHLCINAYLSGFCYCPQSRRYSNLHFLQDVVEARKSNLDLEALAHCFSVHVALQVLHSPFLNNARKALIIKDIVYVAMS